LTCNDLRRAGRDDEENDVRTEPEWAASALFESTCTRVLTPRASRGAVSYGWFEIAGDTLDPYPFGQRGAYCFAGVLEGKGAENPVPAHILDKKRPRDRVQVRIRPLTMRAENKLIEHPYLRHPRMLVSAVGSAIASYTLSSPADFTSPSARRAIQALRCTSP